MHKCLKSKSNSGKLQAVPKEILFFIASSKNHFLASQYVIYFSSVLKTAIFLQTALKNTWNLLLYVLHFQAIGSAILQFNCAITWANKYI